MSDKKTLLEEGTIRRFMKLANMEAIGNGFVNEMYGKAAMMNDDDDIDEGQRTQKPMADDDERAEKKPMEEDVDLEERSTAPAMADDMEMDLDVKDEEEEMDMDAGDMGELTLTDEEAEVFLKVADKVRAAMEMGAPEEMPAPDMGDMDEPMDDMSPDMDMEMDDEEMEEEPMMEDMVNEVARRVARRLNEMKKSK